MRDPYLYEGSDVLKNKLDIRNQDLLEGAEADYVSLRLKDIALNPLKGDYHTPHFLKMHEVVFQDLYEWAGSIRTISIYKEEDVLGGMSIEYADPFDIVNDLSRSLKIMRTRDWDSMEPISRAHEFSDCLASVWKVHPFREGIQGQLLLSVVSILMKWDIRLTGNSLKKMPDISEQHLLRSMLIFLMGAISPRKSIYIT